MQITFPKHNELAQEVAAYLAAHDMRPTTFGRLAVGDPALIKTLERGRELRRDTISAIRRFMATGKAKEGAQ